MPRYNTQAFAALCRFSFRMGPPIISTEEFDMLTWDDDVTPTVTTLPSQPPKTQAVAPTSVAPSSLGTVGLATHTATVPPAQPLAHPAQPTAATAPVKIVQPANVHLNGRRVNAADKRIINGQTDVNQLVPLAKK